MELSILAELNNLELLGKLNKLSLICCAGRLPLLLEMVDANIMKKTISVRESITCK